VNSYIYTDARRFPECDAQLQECSESGVCRTVKQCVPEVCEFELISTPQKGSFHHMKDDGCGRCPLPAAPRVAEPPGGLRPRRYLRRPLTCAHAGRTMGRAVSNCSEAAPCTVPVRFNGDLPVFNNFVGANGRWETGRMLFRPFPGDVGDARPRPGPWISSFSSRPPYHTNATSVGFGGAAAVRLPRSRSRLVAQASARRAPRRASASSQTASTSSLRSTSGSTPTCASASGPSRGSTRRHLSFPIFPYVRALPPALR